MLELRNVVKEYEAGDTRVEALKGVSVSFRDKEFVSVLGPSGCGKTTLLNIIGGLDRYTSGDLVINGRSTKEYSDADWDAYRNHAIGFVFQSYNLIPHQSVLANVELALTLSGVDKQKRRERAIKALEQVGLGDQIHKKPNQMSGGQMQRVAIARALVNDPDILLADEPTGALDSVTSVQIMEILKEVAREKLVIMVTHNGELAEQYSTRTVRLLDGLVTDDSAPFETENEKPLQKKGEGHTSMSFFTALSLSFHNLLTKKTRTVLTAFAGSIGIIGIALILALSNGLNAYIRRVETETLSSYPIMIEQESMDMSGMMGSMMSMREEKQTHDDDAVYSSDIMGNMLSGMMSQASRNNLTRFRGHIIENQAELDALTTDIKYGYKLPMTIYRSFDDGKSVQVRPSTLFDTMGFSAAISAASTYSDSMTSQMMSRYDVWEELIGDEKLQKEQYNVLAGKLPTQANEVALVINSNKEISDYTLYSLGLKDQSELPDMLKNIMSGTSTGGETARYAFDDILSLTFRLTVSSDMYAKDENGNFKDMSGDAAFLATAIGTGEELRVVGILTSKEETAGAEAGTIVYTSRLASLVMDRVNASEVVKAQLASPDTDVLTGLPFSAGEAQPQTEESAEIDLSSLSAQQRAYFESLSEEQRAALLSQYAQKTPAVSSSTYEGNLAAFGVLSEDKPDYIYLYPENFESKEKLTAFIDDYNASLTASGSDEDAIKYTDYVGMLMSGVSTIINAISYILIAFVSISLVVSSIMIGIITYISVLERTKEIGILRAIGASKRDVRRVFNAETLMIGFVAGAIGIGATLLLCIPANIIIKNLSGISGVASLPLDGGLILIAISMLLTLIAGLIPSGIAARKDPVEALRTE
ncbi:MAG: ABC transporter ATP-binding protein/permease [Eubacteriales bacterium]|nr:ABC transporter ATP-binding protein/permease [Eubacteriales bacterium]MDD3882858.1 ABC transporter ATP-binding protein/permease [Eubacteriales bacterium]MDD4512106.1 ABC transporter ATP-binding protein/permease [Eubacteriales bacterium]